MSGVRSPSKPLDADELSPRALKVLQGASGLSREEVRARALHLATRMTERDFLHTTHAGARTLAEVRAWLARRGQSFLTPDEACDVRLRLACGALTTATAALEALIDNPTPTDLDEVRSSILPKLKEAHARAAGREPLP